MNKKRIAPFAFAALIATGVGAGAAHAKERGDEGRDAQILLNSKITLSQAIAAAEQKTGGKAIGAGVENENGTVRIAVEVASDQGVKTMLVDPQNGQVTGTKADHDEDGEEND